MYSFVDADFFVGTFKRERWMADACSNVDRRDTVTKVGGVF